MSNSKRVAEGCVFCRSNKILKGDILATNGSSYLVESGTMPGVYLIIPEYHAEKPSELADDWWKDVVELLDKIPFQLKDYNLSFNIGPVSGQTQKHLHLWVIPRFQGEKAAGSGLAGLIAKFNAT